MQKEIFTKAAAHIGADIHFLTSKPISGQITFPNKEKAFFLRSDIGLNSMATGELVQNKYLCGEVLRSLGFNSPETLKINLGADATFNDRQATNIDHQEIEEFIKRNGFPLFLKPNIGTEGVGVYKIDRLEQVSPILEEFKTLPAAILQKPCIGNQEYRVMVLEGYIELAYMRQAFELTGDGVTQIDDLLKAEHARLTEKGGEITLDIKDRKIDFELARQGFTRSSILETGQKISPLPNVNLSEGAVPVECTERIRENFGDMCKRLHSEIGLSYFGLDLMVDWSRAKPDYDIIEINRRPGFANFAAFSPENKIIVQNVINRTFEILAKRHGYDHLATMFGVTSQMQQPPQPAI